MDDQHGIIMDTMNEVRLTLVQGRSREEINECMVRLVEFTRLHFAAEESLLEQHGFPEVREHRLAHQRLLAEVEEAVQRVQHRDEIQMRSLLLFLREWYMTHIEQLDRQYGVWLNERGIS